VRNFANQSSNSNGVNEATSPTPSVTSFTRAARPVPPVVNASSPPAIPSRNQTPRIVEVSPHFSGFYFYFWFFWSW
jgi:hypothetical protein